MTVLFYSGFYKRRNSTKQPSGGTAKTVALKEGTSMMKPEFLVSTVDWAWNYAHWGARYYYVIDIVAEANELFRVKCELDVLATFRSDIGSYSTLISRSSATFNGEVVDTIYPSKTNPYTLYSSALTAGIFTTNRNSGSVVMGVIGGTGLKFLIMSKTQFDAMCALLFPAITQNPIQWFNSTMTEALVGGLNNIMNAIVLLKWVPIDVSLAQSQLGLTALSEFYVGPLKFDTSGGALVYELTGNTVVSVAARQITFPDRNFTGVTQRGDWLYMQPFATYSLSAPPFGVIAIDGSFLVPSQMTIQATVLAEIISGNAQLILTYYDSGYKMIGRYNTCVSYDIKAGGASYNVGGVVSGAASAALSYVAKDYAGMAGGIAGAAQSLIPQPVHAGAGISGPTPDMGSTWYAESTYYNPITENNAELGRPLGDVRTISSIPGFVQTADAQLAIPGHAEEMVEVNTLLNSGIFYE